MLCIWLELFQLLLNLEQRPNENKSYHRLQQAKRKSEHSLVYQYAGDAPGSCNHVVDDSEGDNYFFTNGFFEFVSLIIQEHIEGDRHHDCRWEVLLNEQPVINCQKYVWNGGYPVITGICIQLVVIAIWITHNKNDEVAQWERPKASCQ